jgi:hypothetical protein
MSSPIEGASWKEFQEAGLLWWVNRVLHLFGWVIVFVGEEGQEPRQVFPARTTFRGFTADAEEQGFERLTAHLAREAPHLLRDVAGPSPAKRPVDP